MPPPAFAPPRSISRSASPSVCSSPTTSRRWASTSSSSARAGCRSSMRATWSAPSASAAPSRPTTTTRSPTPPPAIRTSPRRTEGDTDHGCQESLPRAARGSAVGGRGRQPRLGGGARVRRPQRRADARAAARGPQLAGVADVAHRARRGHHGQHDPPRARPGVRRRLAQAPGRLAPRLRHRHDQYGGHRADAPGRSGRPARVPRRRRAPYARDRRQLRRQGLGWGDRGAVAPEGGDRGRLRHPRRAAGEGFHRPAAGRGAERHRALPSRGASRRGRDRPQRRRFRHGDLMSTARAFRGVIPAMAVPFLDDYKVDEDNLARFAVWLAGCRGVTAVMTNGHTGEVGSLLPDERATVTRVVADAVKGAVRVVSAVCAEGTFEAVEHARAAAHAGADTVDVMPCHMWLRFGVKEDAVYEYVKTIGGESGLDVIVHVYPASTRAAYSTRLMVRLASIPQVKGFKMGERELGAYERDIRALRADAPHVSLLNCMDEYLFATLVHRLDGTLVGCASLVPELINDLFEAMAADDLTRAREINDRIWPIKEAVYGAGEPSGDAHARMKEGMALRGIFRSALARPPVLRPSSAELAAMQAALVASRVPVVDLVCARARLDERRGHVQRTR